MTLRHEDRKVYSDWRKAFPEIIDQLLNECYCGNHAGKKRKNDCDYCKSARFLKKFKPIMYTFRY